MELLIVPFFWGILWKDAYNEMKDHKSVIVEMCIDHSVPLLCLMLDYLFLNMIPFAKRHILALMTVNIAYMIVNLAATLVSGTPVYPPITWKDPMGIGLPVACMFIVLLIFICLECLTKRKLRRNNCSEIV